MTSIPRDPWAHLSSRTPARIALGKTGASLPTREVLSFALAHAKARDAVHAKLDGALLSARLETFELSTIEVDSQAKDRSTYLRRPDLGRRLETRSRDRLAMLGDGRKCDIALMIGDGLSATAVSAHAAPLVEALLAQLRKLKIDVGPAVIAHGARVALGDEVGELLGARLVAVIIGERPGLSAVDGMGVYLTYAPRLGRTDAERNCISNIRPSGIDPVSAAASLAWLANTALAMRSSGVGLKNRSEVLAADEPTVATRISD